MPVLDGVGATLRLRDLQRLGLLPPFAIVAATSDQGQATREACLNAGMDGFLSKPMDLAMLNEELHRLLPMRPAVHD